MPRANRNFSPGLIWHITHRCHQKAFLLRFAKDRRRWRHWLFEARRRYDLCVLNYIVTSNHIHLLVWDKGFGEVSASMQLVAARVGQEYNRRKSRSGAFWADRYHATAVQDGEHLARCMTYIDLNMVRAGAVRHPEDWDVSGYAEIQRPWRRKGVIDFDVLCSLLGAESIKQLAQHLRRAVDDSLGETCRNPAWSESVGVGDEAFLTDLKLRLGPRGIHRTLEMVGGSGALMDEIADYVAEMRTENRD